MALNLTSRKAVLQAITEFDKLGRDEFLSHHHFGKAREYFLLLNGNRYDSKAIAGVAHGYEYPNLGPLTAAAFSGGELTVKLTLGALGFTVVKGAPDLPAPQALVLAENEATAGGEYDFWADDTGSRYHFPNSYRNRVQTGCRFVYYRGVRRKDKKRGAAEYFGTGLIGEVWRDPEQPLDTPARERRWYCAIDEYEPFDAPVPFKRSGKPYENIKGSMGWRTGVREISDEVLEEILVAAGTNKQKHPSTPPVPPDVDAHDECDPSELIVSRPPSSKTNTVVYGKRWAKRTKEIGDWAEEYVYKWLCQTLEVGERETVDWVAQRGETPGWDISYVSKAGQKISVEVKATTAARFSGIDITANEWLAAEQRGEHYLLVLVTLATKARPRIARLWNPVNSTAAGKMQIAPVSFRLTWITTE